MSIRKEQCNNVCRILDDVLANRPTERDSLIIAVRKAFESLEQLGNSERLPSAQPEKRTDKRTETHARDLISREAAISTATTMCERCDTGDIIDYRDMMVESLKVLPSAEKPFKLPKIYVADGYDTVAGEDGNVGFGVYVPDENQIYVAGDVEGEIRARALFHEVCHWVQAMCGRPFDEDEANEFSDIVYEALPSAQPERKHGKWVFVRGEEAGNALYMCSACGKGDIHAPEVRVPYCWNCGAQMEGSDAN